MIFNMHAKCLDKILLESEGLKAEASVVGTARGNVELSGFSTFSM